MILILTGFSLAVLAARGAGSLRAEPVLPDRPWLGPAVLGAAALIDRGMSLAKGRGRATDKLRMVSSKLAAAVVAVVLH